MESIAAIVEELNKNIQKLQNALNTITSPENKSLKNEQDDVDELFNDIAESPPVDSNLSFETNVDIFDDFEFDFDICFAFDVLLYTVHVFHTFWYGFDVF